MSKISFSEYKKRQLELYWDEKEGIEREMEPFQSQYDDGKSHSYETWDKWYYEYLSAREQ